MHKKGLTETTVRKRARRVHIVKERGIVGASIEMIRKKRAQKPQDRKADHEAALKQVQARRDAKKAANKDKPKPGAATKSAANIKQKGGNKANMKGR